MPPAPDKEQTGIFCEGREEVIWEIYGYYQPKENKWYIGSTRKGLEARAGLDGRGYRKQLKFWSAIQTYGWSSFQSHILNHAYSKDEALGLEDFYMERYNSIENGYNSKFNTKPTPCAAHILQLNKDSKPIKIYKTLAEASKRSGLSESTITKALINEEKGGSFYWKLIL